MYRCIGIFYVAPKRGQMYRYSDGPFFIVNIQEGKCIDLATASLFHLKHSGGPTYRCSDGLSFNLNTEEGKCIDLARASLSS
jgi:hypothetical protein